MDLGGHAEKRSEFVRQRTWKSGDGLETRSSPGLLAVTRRRFSLYVAESFGSIRDLHEYNLLGRICETPMSWKGVRHRHLTNCANLRF